MNLVLLFESDFSDARTVRLSGRRFTHIATILKAAPGKKLIVGKLGGEIGEGRLDALDLQAQTVTLTVNWTRPPPPPVPITLVLAMPRPLVFKRVLTHVATLGVKRLIIIGSHRVEKSYFQTPLLQPSAIADILITALEQAVDTIMPQVSIEPSWPQFCHTHTDWIRAADALKRVAHPGAARVPLDFSRQIAHDTVILALGPEGGFIEPEIAQLETLGFLPLDLGPRILKVETAVCVAITEVAQMIG